MSRTRDAFHESAHAIVGHALGRRVERVSISPGGGGVSRIEPLGSELDDEDVRKLAVIFFSGKEGERYAPLAPIAPEANGNGELDWTAIEALLEQGELRETPTDDEALSLFRERIGDEAMEEAYDLARELVNRAAVCGRLARVADALLLRSAISTDELEELLRYAPA